MTLTLNQALFLVLTIAAVVAVVFLVLLLIQLRKTAREGERALAEIRDLTVSLKEIERKLNARMDDVGDFVTSTKKLTAGLAQAGLFLTNKVASPASRFLPVLFPLLLMGLRRLKKKRRSDMAENKDSHFVDSLLTFAAGAAAGFILGILFAPASGKETRKKIKDQAVKTGEMAKEGYEKIAKEAEKGIRVVKEKTGEGIDAIKDFIEKKKEELAKKSPGFPEEPLDK